jgi:hypothetical protein
MDSFFYVKRFNTSEFLELAWTAYSIMIIVTLNTLFLVSLFDNTVNISVMSYFNELKKIVLLRVGVSIIHVILSIPKFFEEQNSLLWKMYNEQQRQSKRLKRSCTNH